MVISLLALIHALAGAMWLGAMGYSLVIVRPRLSRMFDDKPDRVEEAQQVLASGNRWPTATMIGVLWLSGVGLVVASDGGPTAWWLVVALKAALLAAATGLFWWVSWRGWPRRVFALPEELPRLRRTFDLVALAMMGLVGASFAIGVLM